jgi:hypothetical protein
MIPLHCLLRVMAVEPVQPPPLRHGGTALLLETVRTRTVCYVCMHGCVVVTTLCFVSPLAPTIVVQ